MIGVDRRRGELARPKPDVNGPKGRQACPYMMRSESERI